MNLEQRYSEAIDWIHNLGRFGIRPGLERVAALLEYFGNPHQSLRFVHIGGTNGKGSTAAMLASMLKAGGYNIALYTSPYVLSFTNRMAVDGSDIDRRSLVDLVEKAQPAVAEIGKDKKLGPLSEFEVVTALALTYFAQREADLVVLEVGLGGRLDATNVITPLMSLITNISLEHTDVLGDTVEKIAFEKGGIIKPGKPLLTAAEDPAALKVLEERCREEGSPFFRIYPPRFQGEPAVGEPSAVLESVEEDGQYFSYQGFSQSYSNLFTNLRGVYQLQNAALALAATEQLEREGFSIPEDDLRRGLSQTVWPGRLEVLSKKPLLIVDGAHNPAAIKKLSEALPHYFKYKKLILVLGILADKDIEAMLKSILPLADRVVFTRPLLPRAAAPEDVERFARSRLGLNSESLVVQDHGPALIRALELAGPDDAVVVTGSLYTVSDVRAFWEKHLGQN